MRSGVSTTLFILTGDTLILRRLRLVFFNSESSSALGLLVFFENYLKSSFGIWLYSFIRFKTCLLPITLFGKFDEFKISTNDCLIIQVFDNFQSNQLDCKSCR